MSEKEIPSKFDKLDKFNLSGRIDSGLDCIRKKAYADFVFNNEQWLVKIGLIGLYLAGVLAAFLSAVMSIRGMLPAGIGIAAFVACPVASVILHYIAYKTLPSLGTLIKNTPTKFSSPALLDVLTVLLAIAGVIALLGSLYFAIKASTLGVFLGGVSVFVVCGYWMAILLKPDVISISITQKTSAGEEFICLISALVKGNLKMIPVIFGVSIILADISLVVLIFSNSYDFGTIKKTIGYLSSAFLPLIGYLSFLFYYFIFDVLTSIISMSEKLDRLADKK